VAIIKNKLVSTPIQGLEVEAQIRVPGDKSISHRSMILGGIAEGVTKVSGFLESSDCLATMHAMQSMGVKIEKVEADYFVHGVGKKGLTAPESGKIDCGNSGTGMRLLAGLLAAQDFESVLIGDESLNSRPMARIINPLTQMGAQIVSDENNTAPLNFKPVKQLNPISYVSPVASAQVKSCIMLAGLYSDGVTRVSEPKLSRNHTENMLQGFGCELDINGLEVSINGGQDLKATDVGVPADISSSAFFMVLAVLLPNTEIKFHDLCVNSSRSGVIEILKLMGADIELQNQRVMAGEQIADVVVKSSQLIGIDVPHEYIASAIDEFPVLFIAASFAKGQTRLTNAMELRKKESDRITVMADGLKTLGIDCHELDDGLVINGGVLNSGKVDSHDDHRCAMSFLIAGQLADAIIEVDNCENIITSFPSFLEICNDIGLNIK
jgi:3-phosphoshikimate 1-carboxyvinyltransferase